MPSANDIILEHYRKEAELLGADAASTMRDAVTRGREIASVEGILKHLSNQGHSVSSLLDIGCGNGYLLEVLRKALPRTTLTGLEYTPEMIALARSRSIDGVELIQGDVRKLPMRDHTFDVVVTERCVINVMDRDEQATSFREIARVLKPGGFYICIESFLDALDELNAARDELGLPPNVVPHHNLWFEKDWFFNVMNPLFEHVNTHASADAEIPPSNFLSSHYFMSRVVYAAVTKREVIYNTHFVRFFTYLPPMGNYCPIQLFLLKRR
jgi:ubiquinone/menaquinone biosynthesis C-methylase UbiE